MIHTITYNSENFPIPSGKVFEKLLNLNEPLLGQSVKVKSIFNPADKDPSMVVFYKEENGFYRFKDFSANEYGDMADLAQFIFKTQTRQQAFIEILNLFKREGFVPNQISSGPIIPVVKEIVDYTLRQFNKRDEQFFKEHYISPSFIKEYYIKPIASYILKISKGSEVKEFTFENPMSYGYFTKEGELYKIYNPGNKNAKYLKVKDYIQGSDQLTWNKQCCIITSSLKDIGSFKSFGLNKDFDLVAPDSENILISPEFIKELREAYPYVFSMMDNDSAGMKSMLLYKTTYDLPYIHWNVEKDVAQCTKDHGPKNSKLFFISSFKTAMQKLKQNE